MAESSETSKNCVAQLWHSSSFTNNTGASKN